MSDFIAYHNTDKREVPFKPTKEFDFFSRKPASFLRKAIGERVWTISGSRAKGEKILYSLVGMFTPLEVRPEADGSSITGEGIPFEPPIDITNESWLLDLLREQNNFSYGFSRIRSEETVAALLAVRVIEPEIYAPLIAIFHDKLQVNAHQLFQKWRVANPSGFFINCKGTKNSLLHNASCQHLGDASIEADEHTIKRKVCAQTISELRTWANEHQLTISDCKHCTLNDNSAQILSYSGYAEILGEILATAISVAIEEEFDTSLPGRIQTEISRIIRDTAIARRVKILHGYRCQLCGHTIQLTDGRFYAEAHHIQPLGSKHAGRDRMDNLLCVCPNHHVELDNFLRKLSLSDLRTVSAHKISSMYLDYHNSKVDEIANN